MITEKIKELNALKEKATALEAAIESERARELAALPKTYGFEDARSFADAVLEASGRGGGRRPGRPSSGGTGTRRRRGKITDETRATVKKMVEAGRTGKEIAQAVGISLPSVHNVKKALGLIRKG